MAMTSGDPCYTQRAELEAALQEWQRMVEEERQATPDAVGRASPPMGGDLGSRLYETIGHREAAHRRYRTAVRSLAECLRTQRAPRASR